MNMDANLPVSVTQGFVSYRRDDNDDFRQVVDRLHSDLQAMYEAMTGKRVDIFKDRESIGWGEEWRRKIQSSVERATVFIPVITMRYFTSQNCVEELLLFHATARRLGVTDLILPVVLFGASQIREDDTREEVQLIASLNYKNLETAWRSGYESPEWLTVIAECVSELDLAIRRVEDALAEGELEAVQVKSKGHVPSEGGQEDDAESSGADLIELSSQFELIEPLVDEAGAAVHDLGNHAKEAFGDDMEGLSAAETKVKLLAAARKMSEPALRLGKSSQELETRIVDLDGALRELVTELSAIDLPMAQEQLQQLLDTFRGAEGLAETESQVNELVETLQFASLMNINLRKSLRPAIRGLRSMQTAIGIFRSWDNLAEG